MTEDRLETLTQRVHASRHPAGYGHACSDCREIATVMIANSAGAGYVPQPRRRRARRWLRRVLRRDED